MVNEAGTHEEDVRWQARKPSHHVTGLDGEDHSLKDGGKVFWPEGEHAKVLALCSRPRTSVGQWAWGEGQGRGKGKGTEMGGGHDRIKLTFALAISGRIHYHSHLSHVSICACQFEL